MIIHKTKPLAIHEWDWKAQPDMQSIADVVTDFQEKFHNGVRIIEIETGSDENAVVIGDSSLTEEIAKQAYHNRFEIEEGVDATELNWNEAFNYLTEVRSQYNFVGVSGIPALTVVINPLLIRYSNGERSKELYDAIMELS